MSPGPRPSAAVLGLGQISALGVGIEALDAPPPPGAPRLAPKAALPGVDPRLVRRLDGFTQRALAVALQAVAGAAPVAPERQGLLLATGWGPVRSSFAFLEETKARGDGLGSPTTFSNSAHGAAAGAISTVLGLRGPIATVTGPDLPWVEALAIALDWLGRRADRVLLLSADEHHPLTGEVPAGLADRVGRLALEAGERAGASTVYGESFTAFYLGPDGPKRIFAPQRAVTSERAQPAERDWPWGWNPTAEALQVLRAAARGEAARCVACAPGGGAWTVEVGG